MTTSSSRLPISVSTVSSKRSTSSASSMTSSSSFSPCKEECTTMWCCDESAVSQGSADEGRHPCRGAGHPNLGRDTNQTEADGRNRRQASVVAHHEVIFRPRRQRFHHLLWLSRLRHQGVFRELLPAHVGCDVRHGQERNGSPSSDRRALEGDAGRYGRPNADRRTREAGELVCQGRRRLLFDVW